MKSNREKTSKPKWETSKITNRHLIHDKENIWLTKLAAIQHFKRESKVTELSFSKFACVRNSAVTIRNKWSKMMNLKQSNLDD